MLDLNHIIANPDLYKKGFIKKNSNINVDEIFELAEKRKILIQKTEDLRAQQNQTSKEIMKVDPNKKQELLIAMGQLKEVFKKGEDELKQVEEKLNFILSLAPNLPHETTPEGKEDKDGRVERVVGKPREFKFNLKNHAELGELTDTIDILRATKTSGSRFGYLKNEAVLLEFALVQWIMQKLANKKFVPIAPPVLVREEAMYATGFFPADRNEIYTVNPDDDKLFLTGTSEVALTMLHAQEFLNEEDLPKRYVGFSTCFRREAGAAGRDSVGIFRVHQFDKIEMFSFCHPEKSWEEHELLLSLEEEILKELKLPYQIINIPAGDLGAPAAKKYDCEVWIPSEKRYRELTSTSNCTDFQARRAKIKYKTEKGEKAFVHTLNGTASAIGRTLAAIFENYQNADGSIEVPEVLQKFCGFAKIPVRD